MVDDTNRISEDSWFAWSKHVLMQLEQDTKKIDKVELCLADVKQVLINVRIDIAQLKIKAGIWGLIGGAIPIIIGLGIWFIKTHFGSGGTL